MVQLGSDYDTMFPPLPTTAGHALTPLPSRSLMGGGLLNGFFTGSLQPQVSPTSTRFLRDLFAAIAAKYPNISQIPPEIQDTIIGMAQETPKRVHRPLQRQSPGRHPALTPLATGASPFMALPTELRCHILKNSLPDRSASFDPRCENTTVQAKPKPKRKKKRDSSEDPDRLAFNVPNLMTLCRKICGEITEVLYEERTFVVHVHEGLKTGGVEVLNAGRQPLQYQDCTSDQRFAKFKHGEAFGFNRMKKVIIQIHPTTEDQDRHLALNTHFMNLALCRLLERRNDDNGRITSIKIEFVMRTAPAPATVRASRASILRHEQPWLDANGPKQSSIHNVSDMEIILRPFAMLTRCHFASVTLPSYLASKAQLSSFVSNLEQSMMSKTGTLMPSDTLDYKVEQLRAEMEAHVVSLLHGNGRNTQVNRLTDKELLEDVAGSDADLAEAQLSMRKHTRSSSGVFPDAKRLQMTEDELEQINTLYRQDLKRVIEQSFKDAGVTKTKKEINQLVKDAEAGERELEEADALAEVYEEDWQRDLVEQWLEGQISDEVLEELGVEVPTKDDGEQQQKTTVFRDSGEVLGPLHNVDRGVNPKSGALLDTKPGDKTGTRTSPRSRSSHSTAGSDAMDLCSDASVANDEHNLPVAAQPSISGGATQVHSAASTFTATALPPVINGMTDTSTAMSNGAYRTSNTLLAPANTVFTFQPPRALLQNEDSGISMQAPDDSSFEVVGQKADGDEDMVDAPAIF